MLKFVEDLITNMKGKRTREREFAMIREPIQILQIRQNSSVTGMD